MYTVKQLSGLAGVTVRTLHYYDEIGLLVPSSVSVNGYRHYTDEALLKLQQILFFRELDFSLTEIKTIMQQPEFDLLAALHQHRQALHDRMKRLRTLIQTVDSTIFHLTGEVEMNKKQLFAGFSAEEEQRYADEARQLYDEKTVNESYQLWNSYSAAKKDQIKAEGLAIYTDLADLIARAPADHDVQQVIARWHQHIRYFYEPTVEILRGLGQLYVENPDFTRSIGAVHPDLPEFMRQAITVYCDNLG